MPEFIAPREIHVQRSSSEGFIFSSVRGSTGGQRATVREASISLTPSLLHTHTRTLAHPHLLSHTHTHTLTRRRSHKQVQAQLLASLHTAPSASRPICSRHVVVVAQANEGKQERAFSASVRTLLSCQETNIQLFHLEQHPL